MTTSPSQPQSSPSPTANNHIVLEPMSNERSPIAIIEALLKYPGRIIHDIQHNSRSAIGFGLLLLALLALTAYGVVLGSFSGGSQLWIAPVKIGIGTLLSILICLPSLYIFACLGGIEARFRTVAGTFFAAVSLTGLLLIGFAPVAWIFSQSTDSVAFMSTLHLGLWAISILFGLRLIEAMGRLLSGSAKNHLRLWGFIFIVVCLQMMTTLRPIVGRSDQFLTHEKKFFIAHWFETISGSASAKPRVD